MRFAVTALFAALLFAPAVAGVAYATDPAPSVDSLIERIAELRRQRADLDKREAELVAALKAELKRLQELADKLGLNLPLPKPPEPPVPVPPVDPLRAKVLDAVKASAGTDAEKRKQCLDLAALYRAAGELTAKGGRFADADSLLKGLREAAASMIGADALTDVRRVVAGELAAVLPTVADAALTDAHRAAAAKVFERLAGILEEAGK